MKEMKIDDLRAVKSEEVKEPAPHEMVEVLVMHRERIEELKSENAKLHETVKELRNVRTGMAECNKDIEVLKAECIDLKEERDRLQQEVIDLKKTISKMQQSHEAEVQDLKDQLGEAKAETNAIRKHKDEILKKHTEYADALDNDSVAFEEILGLAIILERSAKSMQEMSKMLQEKTEGKV